MATRNRYAEIMAQYAQSQPFSFFGMPSGGFNPYAPDYTGGFTPYERLVTPQPIVNPVEPTVPMVGGGGGGGRSDADREGPSAFSQMTPAERAAYYAERPIEGSLALGAQDLFGNATLMGQISKNANPDAFYDSRLEKLGLDPESFAYGPPAPAPVAPTEMRTVVERWNGEESPPAGQGWQAKALGKGEVGYTRTVNVPSSDSGGGGYYGDATPGGSFGFVQAPGERGPGGTRGYSPSPGTGSYGDARSDLRGGDGFAKGGYVSMQHLGGTNPEGPDDGYAALKDGEFVINDKAVKKYGIELMNLINSGKISKGKLRGLLEM